MSDLISRQAAIDAVNGMPDCPNGFSGTYDKDAIIGILEDVPSVEELKSEALETAYLEGYTAGQNAQPKYVALHESCTDCPLYDRKNYNCPRFNRVIPMAIRDAQTQVKALSLPSVQPQRWIPVVEALPKDDEEVIVTCLDDSGDTPFRYTTVAWHYKGMWVCDNERCPFVTAWMPLPKPYREERTEE